MAPTRGVTHRPSVLGTGPLYLTFGLTWLLLLSSCFLVALADHHTHHHQRRFMTSSPSEYLFGQLLDNYLQAGSNESCSEIWCESSDPAYFDEDEYDEDGTRGFWLEPPPDDILYMPPPPMPPSFHASLLSMENGSLKEFIIGEDPQEGYRCNFCKLFADPLLPSEDPMIDLLPKVKSTSEQSFVSSFYVLITSLAVLLFIVLLGLMKYKKWKIFPMSDSCPILSGGSVLGHHKSSGSSGSPSDTRLPVVNEKSPQSIIMDAPLASLGKKSTISTTGKYWKRMPAAASSLNGGNIFSMEDRRGMHAVRSLGGSSTGMSEHPYSDAASCTSSPVYAELDPSVAGSCHTPSMIGAPGGGGGSIISSSFSPYAASNTYSEVPDNMRGHLVHLGNSHPLHSHHQGMSPSPLLTDSSTYDNAAYLPASSQPFLASGGGNHYATRSLRRLAAQRSAVLSAAGNGGGNGTSNGGHQQVSTPLLAGHPYHVQPFAGTLHHHHQHHLQSTPLSSPGGQFQQFLTGGRPLKKPRPGAANHHHPQQQQQQTSFGSYHRNNTGPNSAMLNHYVTSDADLMLAADDHTQLTSPPAAYGGIGSVYNGGGGPFSAYLDSSSNGSSNRKSSSSSQYTEMPLLQNSNSSATHFNNHSGGGGMNGTSNGAIGHYRMSATCSANDLNSAASSSSGGSGNGGNHITNSTSSANSSTSLKRPLPPVPSAMIMTAATNNTGHVRL